MSAMQLDNERLQYDMNLRIDGSGSGFTAEQMNQLLMQAADLQREFVEVIAKEREVHPLNISGYRSEISRISREWQTLTTMPPGASQLSPLRTVAIPVTSPVKR